MDTLTVETSRTRTHCLVGGPEDGEPVLLAHGNLTSGRFWQDVADGFPGGYRLVAPDLRAFGRTERRPVDATRGLRESPAYKAPDEDELMVEVLLTAVGDTAYPGDVTASPNWPGVAAGRSGVNNAFAGRWCDTSAFAGPDVKPPVLWLRGDQDQVISDESMFDFGTLGRPGAAPGRPGMDAFPPQPQIAQTRAMLERYRAGGGSVREVVFDGGGHGPPIERPAELREQLLAHIQGEP